MDVQLNFINRSNDQNNSQIVIFQKNVASDEKELGVAWHVIRDCGPNRTYPFTCPRTMQLSATDSQGNSTPRLDAEPGQQFTVSYTDSGLELVPSGPANSTEVQVVNALPEGAIDANIYKDGLLLATRRSIASGQRADFEFKPSIWIGTAPAVKQGELMNPAILTQVETQISLVGIAKANVVMTGGGPGPTAPPFQFSLEGVVPAAASGSGPGRAGAAPPAGPAAAAPPARRSNRLRTLWNRLVGGRPQ